MNTGAKVGITIALAGFIFGYRQRPVVKVLSTNVPNKSVTYQMSIGGYSITDTFFLGDIPNLIPVGDGKHFFLAQGNVVTEVVDISIGYLQNGGFKAIKSLLISF